MKTQSLSLINKLNERQISLLTSQVSEVLHMEGADNVKSKLFSSAELWSIQRKRRVLVVR